MNEHNKILHGEINGGSMNDGRIVTKKYPNRVSFGTTTHELDGKSESCRMAVDYQMVSFNKIYNFKKSTWESVLPFNHSNLLLLLFKWNIRNWIYNFIGFNKVNVIKDHIHQNSPSVAVVDNKWLAISKGIFSIQKTHILIDNWDRIKFLNGVTGGSVDLTEKCSM